jgi:hypothetical protein
VKGVEPIYTSHVREQFPDLRDLFRAGEAVQGLVFDHGWAAVVAVVGREIDAIDRKLDGPNPLTHVEYAHLHGQRRGLRGMQDAAFALERHYEAALQEQERKHESSTGEAVAR